MIANDTIDFHAFIFLKKIHKIYCLWNVFQQYPFEQMIQRILILQSPMRMVMIRLWIKNQVHLLVHNSHILNGWKVYCFAIKYDAT